MLYTQRNEANEMNEPNSECMSKFSPHISYAQYAKTYEYIYSWNLGIRSFVRGRATWQMPQYVTNVKSADLCQYDVQSTTASRTGSAAVRVFARKSTRNQMKIDSPDDRSARLHDYTRLPRLSALANRMSTADGQSVPPSLLFNFEFCTVRMSNSL